VDQQRQEGKQIVIVDEEGHEEALAVYVNWGTPEIARYIHKIFTVHECKIVTVAETKENVYEWRVIKKPGAPPAKEMAITLGSKCFRAELEEGSRSTQGEWLSRKIGHIVPPLDEFQGARGGIAHPREPVQLLEGAPAVLPADLGGQRKRPGGLLARPEGMDSAPGGRVLHYTSSRRERGTGSSGANIWAKDSWRARAEPREPGRLHHGES
jgi:hypothetical protein